MKKAVLLFVYFYFAVNGAVYATSNPKPDPGRVKFITSDVDNFWKMHARLKKAKTYEDSVTTLKKYYLDKASSGLKEHLADETKKGFEVAEWYLLALKSYPKFFASIKQHTLSINQQKKAMQAAMIKEKELNPNAVFPDIYFVVGFINTPGRFLNSGSILIGTEFYALTATTDTTEFAGTPFAVFTEAIEPLDGLPFTVVHETIHAQHRTDRKDLLTSVLKEGVADFITYLTMGEFKGGTVAMHAYGNANEEKLWKLFKSDLEGGKKDAIYRWLYSDGSGDMPRDLGYYIGYKIAETYYAQATDKKQAIVDIIEVADADKILEQSGYANKFGATR